MDMPTGTLYVNTEIDIYQRINGPNNCSLIFQWISKTKTLSAPDDLLLQKPQPISSLPIYVDFLPALESMVLEMNMTISLFLKPVMFVTYIIRIKRAGGSLGVWLNYIHSPRKCLTNIGDATRS